MRFVVHRYPVATGAEESSIDVEVQNEGALPLTLGPADVWTLSNEALRCNSKRTCDMIGCKSGCG